MLFHSDKLFRLSAVGAVAGDYRTQAGLITGKYLHFWVKTEELMNGHVNKNSATLHFVELAGSGRQTQSKSVGDRFKEGVNINLSLSVLGRVIRTLSGVNRRAERIPYRDSKLTLILRDSLGGNSRTAVIVNVHLGRLYYSGTLSTLQYAAACGKIENRVCANEGLAGDIVTAYKSEIA
ncbi:unnamed protein product [Angiostrongylus costaricensis]|uniref:Kinesin motor domain-containing protein n=1 Tax=Angiostrongylus costaricensis TaxID=334426 RepID=A0A0R3PFI7_ANGCS|nr:unnamed protein product [Angiostrongylus costaricensis]